MKIEKFIQEDRQAKLTVEYAPEAFEGFKRRAAKKISKNTKIPGFRPGKAPYQVVLNHYGEGAIIQEAIDLLLDSDYATILEQAEIEPSGAGNLESIESYDPPKFVFLVPLQPEIDLGDYREIRKAYEPEDFDDAKLDDHIKKLLRNSATIVPADRPAAVDDLVYFNLSGEFLNPAEEEDATITDKTPQQMVIPSEDSETTNEWPFPGFGRALLGVKAGDVKELQFTYPEDFEEEDYQGKSAIFTVEVQSVKSLELPEFDEDFVQNLGDFESPDDYREALDASLREEHQISYDNQYFNDLLNRIVEDAKLSYPPQMLEHEEEHVLEDIKSRLERQNLDFETYLQLRNTDEETFMTDEVRPAAKQRLERSLVVDALIEAEGLTLDQDLLSGHVSDLVSELVRSGRVEELQKQMGKDEFSRFISYEGVSRTMNAQLQNRLKLIATGQPIPEPEEIDTTQEDAEEPPQNERSEIDAEFDADDTLLAPEEVDVPLEKTDTTNLEEIEPEMELEQVDEPNEDAPIDEDDTAPDVSEEDDEDKLEELSEDSKPVH